MAVCENLNIDDFKTWVICPGDIFYQTKAGKNIHLHAPGDLINHSFFSKYLPYKDQLYIEMLVDRSLIAEGKAYLEDWIKKENILEQRRAALEFLNWVHSKYWKNAEKACLLDLSMVFFESFFKSHSLQELLKDTNIEYFKRSLAASAIGSVLSICLGYFNPTVVMDFYNIVYLLDVKIHESFSSFKIWESFESDRINGPLNYDLSEKEKKIIADHVGEIDFNNDHFDNIKNLQLLNLLNKHHETINGKGFPFALTENELSDLECVLIFSNNLISIVNHSFNENDGREFFKNILNYNDRDLGRTLGRRISKISVNVFKNFDEVA